MKTEKVFDIRFLVPALLVIISTFLADPYEFLNLIKGKEELALGVISVIILASGFVISSVTEVGVTTFGRKTPNYSDGEKNKLRSIFSWLKDADLDKSVNLLELSNWLLMDKLPEDTRNQIHKRWNMAMANFNCFVSIILSIIISTHLFQGITNNRIWCASVVILLFIFLTNGIRAYISVLEMDKVILKYND